MSSAEYKEQLRTHQEWVFNTELWTEVKFGNGFNMMDAANWIDKYEGELVGKYLIQSSQMVFSNAQDATLFMITRK